MSQDLSIIRYEELGIKDNFQQQRVFFTWGKRSNKVSGILRLVQLVIKLLLTTPGTDTFNATLGTVIPSLIKKGISASSVTTIRNDIMISIQDLERQIVNLQAAEAIPDVERLQEIEIRKVEFLETSNEWNIELSVLSEAGQTLSFDLAPFLRGQ